MQKNKNEINRIAFPGAPARGGVGFLYRRCALHPQALLALCVFFFFHLHGIVGGSGAQPDTPPPAPLPLPPPPAALCKDGCTVSAEEEEAAAAAARERAPSARTHPGAARDAPS